MVGVVVVVVVAVVAVAVVVEVRVVKLVKLFKLVKLVKLISVYFFDIFTSKKAQNPQFFTLLTSKCASRHNVVHFFDTFSASEPPKVVRDRQFLTLLTSKCASRHNGVHFFDISTSKSGPKLVCFVHFDFQMCFAPQRRALFQHLNFQKWSEPLVFLTFWLRNVLRATTACTFSTSQLPKVVRRWGVLYILTWKCASRHNGVQFFISHLASWLRTRRFSEPTFRPSGAPNHWKNRVSRLSYLFAHLHLLSSDLFSSDSFHLCFSTIHIVGSFTYKLPSIKDLFGKFDKTMEKEEEHVFFPSWEVNLLIGFQPWETYWTSGMVWLEVSPAITSNLSTRVAPSDWRSFVHYVSRKLEFLRLVAVVQIHVVLVYGRPWSDQQKTGSLHLFRAWLQCLYHQNHSTHGWLVVCWLVGWVVGSLGGWVVGWLGGWVVGWLGGWVVGWLGGWVAGWLGGWVAGWLGGWVVGWLVGWVHILTSSSHRVTPKITGKSHIANLLMVTCLSLCFFF